MSSVLSPPTAHFQGQSQDLASIPVQYFKGVGPEGAKKLAKIGIFTAQDVIFHLPYRYQDRTRITPMAFLRPQEYAVIEGEVIAHQVTFRPRRNLICTLRDGSGSMRIRFFNFNTSQVEQFASKPRIRCFGEVRFSQKGLQMIHPEYQVIRENLPVVTEEHFTPVYSSTEGVNQRQLRQLTSQVFNLLKTGKNIDEYLPSDILKEMQLPTLRDAVEFLHFPSPDTSLQILEEGKHPAQQRLILEELLAYHLSMQRLRERLKEQSSPILTLKNDWIEKFISQLPFQLTNAQKQVWNDIQKDLISHQPMLRLVQGDVGAGKTVVAGLAALQAVSAGYQAALMAPTEILAEQHYKEFQKWFSDFPIHVCFLSGKLTAKQKRETQEAIAEGKANIVIGTHALVQDAVNFSHLGLVIIDEQHRFGVDQRLTLAEKGRVENSLPHQLIMTATPIPRTLAMSLYSHLDSSVINEMPPGRQPVVTVAIPDSRRAEVIERVKHVCEQGQQVYWVCTLIEESEQLTCQAAEKTALQLQEALPQLKVGLVHGRLTATEKLKIMTAFKEGHIHLLVATTVIEVGVHVSNATLMIIENPERLGLSQLHQLRGRVGRGSVASHCVLLYQTPLSVMARERLDALRKTHDGFEIAECDLRLRGPGEVLGTRQTGTVHLRVADLYRDREWMPTVQHLSKKILKDHPDKVECLIKRWLQNNEQYGRA